MATLLVTRKMNPALAARVDKSVRGGRASSPVSMRRVISIARFALVAALVFGVYTAVTQRRQARAEIDRDRAALVERVRAEAASLELGELDAVSRAEHWLSTLARPDFTEMVADELRRPDGLRATLSRPLVYVRGPIDGFSPPRFAETTAASPKDALLLCLLDPPANRAERTVLDKVRVAYLGGADVEERTSNARRLHEAVVGLPYLAPPWADRVRAAEDGATLAQLRRDFDRAPIARAKLAAKADLLVVALDEPGDGTGPTELDGERPHFVRLAIVDAKASSVLLAVRRRVDPSWISQGRRPTYAAGLDGCALAFDVHEDLRRR